MREGITIDIFFASASLRGCIQIWSVGAERLHCQKTAGRGVGARAAAAADRLEAAVAALPFQRAGGPELFKDGRVAPDVGEPLAARLKKMTNLEEVVWCQEEPRNNGAWFFVASRIELALSASGHDGMRPIYAGRDRAASPATGLASRHAEQQQALLLEALGLKEAAPTRRDAKKKKG